METNVTTTEKQGVDANYDEETKVLTFSTVRLKEGPECKEKEKVEYHSFGDAWFDLSAGDVAFGNSIIPKGEFTVDLKVKQDYFNKNKFSWFMREGNKKSHDIYF